MRGVTTYMEEKFSIERLAKSLVFEKLETKKLFLRTFFENIDEKQAIKLLETCCKAVFKLRYDRINKRLDSMFFKNPSLKPVIAARMIRYYLKVPQSMIPLLVKLAQKSKDRVRKRAKKEVTLG